MKIEKLKKVNWLILSILVLASLLRLWRLNVNPPSLSPDEAALGYNAYSILKTGRDEYGKILPIIFKSFGDYKPGLYVYLTVPFVATLGLNEWSVRLPSALAGVVAVYLLYLIVKKFTEEKENQLLERTLPIISALLLAINPWHIHLSRGAWEVNVSLTLALSGIYFFLKSLKNSRYLIFSASLFALTFIAYQGAKLSTTIILSVLLLIFFKDAVRLLKSNLKIVILSLIVAILISLPVLISFDRGQTGRLSVFSIFSYPRSRDYIEKMLSQNNEKIGDINYLLFHNETLNFKRGILGRYFNHFSGRFLFFEGDYQNPKHSSPNHGMLLMVDLLLLPLGVFYLIRKGGNFSKLTFLWLILSPLPAVLTRDQVQAVRGYNMVIPLTLISAYGFASLLEFVKGVNKRLRFIVFGLIIILFITSLIYFLDSYFIHLPIHNAKYWSYGYKQVVQKMLPIQDNYKTVYFQQSYDQPYIYYLFYSKYDPSVYQKQANLSYYLGPDVGLVEKLDNIHFSGWSWPYATGEKSTLIIGNSVAIPADFNPKDYNLISEIKYPDGYMSAFRIVETK